MSSKTPALTVLGMLASTLSSDVRPADAADMIARGKGTAAEAEMNSSFEAVQKRLVGRIYTAEQLQRVKRVAAVD